MGSAREGPPEILGGSTSSRRLSAKIHRLVVVPDGVLNIAVRGVPPSHDRFLGDEPIRFPITHHRRSGEDSRAGRGSGGGAASPWLPRTHISRM